MIKKPLLALALACLGGAANAFTFLGTAAGHNATIGGVLNATVFAGKLKFSDAWFGNVQAVCADLNHFIYTGQSWPVSYVPYASLTGHMVDCANIVGANFAVATSNDDAQALQLAVWEALVDDGATPDFANGGFKVVSGASAGVLAQAAVYYGAKSTPHAALLFHATGGSGQDQLTPVPEPTALMALGFGLTALIRRRRR